jgi:ABC-2 type transport system permease protein
MFLKSFFSKNYKWWYLFNYSIKQKLNYFLNELLFQLNQFVALFAVILIFIRTGSGFDLVSYILIGNIFFALTIAPSSWDVANNIKDGEITKYLLYPNSYTKFNFVKSLGEMIVTFLGFGFILGFLLLIFNQSLIFSFLSLFWLILFLPIAYIIRFLTEFIAGTAAFWMVESFGLIFLTQSLFTFFSGSLFPLTYLGQVGKIAEYTPFAFTFYHPMQIYLGKYDTNQTINVFLGGLAWCFILYILSKIIFKLGHKKNESVGL